MEVNRLDDATTGGGGLDGTTAAIIGVVAVGIIGLLIFLQWKYVFCEQILCLRFKKRGGSSKTPTPKGKKRAEEAERGSKVILEGVFDVIDNEKKGKGKNDLPDGLSSASEDTFSNNDI